MPKSIKTNLIIFSIILLRLIDLFITHKLAVLQKGLDNELNILVRIFNIKSEYIFYSFEIIGIVFFIYCYLKFLNNKDVFNIKASSFINYLKLFFFKKTSISLYDYLFKISLRNTLVLAGKIIPVFIITTSIIYILNNLLIYKASFSKYYYKLFYQINDVLPITFIIYVLVPLFLVLLLVVNLYKYFKLYNFNK